MKLHFLFNLFFLAAFSASTLKGMDDPVFQGLNNLSYQINILSKNLEVPVKKVSLPLIPSTLLPRLASAPSNFFEYTVGIDEQAFRKLIGWNETQAIANKGIPDVGAWVKKYENPIGSGSYPRAALFNPGQRFSFTTFAKEKSNLTKQRGGKFHILRYDPNQPYTTNIYHLQALPENKGAALQVASTLFGPLEGGMISPQAYLTNMKHSKAQGEFASMGAIGSTIWTKYFLPTSPDHSPKPLVTNSASSYLNNYYYLLQEVGIPVSDKNPGLPDIDWNYIFTTPPSEEQSKNVGVFVKENVIVTYGVNASNKDLELPVMYDFNKNEINAHHNQIISQIFCSALNLGSNNFRNKSEKEKGNAYKWAHLILKGSYQATIKAAANRGVKKLFLTMLGGGVFNNNIKWIGQAVEEVVTSLVPSTNMEVYLIYRPETGSSARDINTDGDFLARMITLSGIINGEDKNSISNKIKELPGYLKQLYHS